MKKHLRAFQQKHVEKDEAKRWKAQARRSHGRSHRAELSREPLIWWNFSAASFALFVLILAVNQVADAVRDILDPRTAAEQE